MGRLISRNPVFAAPMLSAGNPRSLLALMRLRGLREIAFLQESRYRFNGCERFVSELLVIDTLCCCILNVIDEE
ncbi:hypothetical protein [Exiguobacterium sp. s183]|uniref:hypothetical protein n=1 Tax=Exiguobacterium sp. s183 TaxID=2751262 RepID=UPI001BEA41DA|nr:hypothetical protein [Exiguobacterium sp. s183]